MIDIEEILSELKSRLTTVDTAIHSLELMSVGEKRRGRPPKWVSDMKGKSGVEEPNNRPGKARKESV